MSLNFVNRTSCNHKDWLALERVSQCKDYKPNETLFTPVFTELSQSKNFDAINDIMKRIKTEEKKVGVSSQMISFTLLLRFMEMLVGMLKKLLELSSVCQICPSTRTFNFVLNLLVSSKRYKIVNEVYMDASRLGVVVNTCSFNILVKGLCKNDDVKKGFELLDEFPKQDCQPNVITYSTLHCLCRNGRTDESFKLLDRMENEVCDPDTISFSLLISGLGKQGRADEGIERLDRTKMNGFKPNSGSYQVVLYSIINSKKFIDAKHYIDKNRTTSEGFSPSFFVVQDGDRGTLQQ
ncbi:hypothetical protein MKW92_035395 [Papaver armeniacum]|nr:hypothetical protein MKW92_035395 [Papaver armeniacum]